MRLLRDKRGATAIEYGLIASLIGVAAMAGFSNTGTGVKTQLCKVAGKIGEAGKFEVPGCGGAEETPPLATASWSVIFSNTDPNDPKATDFNCVYRYNYRAGALQLDSSNWSTTGACSNTLPADHQAYQAPPQTMLDAWSRGGLDDYGTVI